ncbi:MAG: hypothetical protein LUH05_03055 [Candidatus Gastranaerophilales bacterium]|nr:hypothetical protein [Candidatus Gastranaerophilales bacterium]
MTEDDFNIPFDDSYLNLYCPVCGNPLVIEEGKDVCYYCGWCEDEN